MNRNEIKEKFKETISWLGDFVDGSAIFRSGDYESGKFGVISDSGEILIEAKYDQLSQVEGNNYFAVSGDFHILINERSQPLVDEIGVFSNGMAPFRKGALWGYMNQKGVEVITPQFNFAEPFHARYQLVAQVIKDGQKVFIDEDGRLIKEVSIQNMSILRNEE